MDVILFEYVPSIFILILAGVLTYYIFKLYLMSEEVKHAKTITDVVLFIVGTLVISIMLIFMVALAIEAIV